MPKNKKIALIYAGGTIGMELRNGELAPPKNDKDFQNACMKVVNEFNEMFGVEVEMHFYDKKDSTERVPSDWEKLFHIIQNFQKKYLAVVVAHGTDTLANTASAISFAFGHPDHPGESSLSIPVVLTASQQPIYRNGSDGRFNLFHALETAARMSRINLNRVAISFWDMVFLGSRAIKTHDRKFDAFDSPAVQPMGLITSRGVELSHFVHPLKQTKKSSPNFSDGISIIEISPSAPSGLITTVAEAPHTRVLVIKTLGEGNIPGRLISEAREQSQKGKIIVLCSPFAGGSVGGSIYELGGEAIRAGAIPGGDMTPAAIDAKCSWLIGNGVTDREEFARKLQISYVGEITEVNTLKRNKKNAKI